MTYQKIRKAVFPVAGLGTRFLPATKAMPKEMLTVVDKPLIQYAVEEAVAAGIEEIIFITGKGKSAIEDHFDHAAELENILLSRGGEHILGDTNRIIPDHVQLIYTRQGIPLGLGHAVGCAESIVGNEPFAVVLADDVFNCQVPCLKQMIDAYNEVGGNLVAAMEVPRKDTAKYGVIDPGADKGAMVEINGLVEKPDPADAPSNLTISGRYILQPEVFDHLAKGATGSGGEIQLTDAMAKLLGSQPFHAFRYEGERFDCGDKLGWLRANIAFAMQHQDMQETVPEMIQDLLKGLVWKSL